jgi:hypothetical protein
LAGCGWLRLIVAHGFARKNRDFARMRAAYWRFGFHAARTQPRSVPCPTSHWNSLRFQLVGVAASILLALGSYRVNFVGRGVTVNGWFGQSALAACAGPAIRSGIAAPRAPDPITAGAASACGGMHDSAEVRAPGKRAPIARRDGVAPFAAQPISRHARCGGHRRRRTHTAFLLGNYASIGTKSSLLAPAGAHPDSSRGTP